jgi:hypothetical protein
VLTQQAVDKKDGIVKPQAFAGHQLGHWQQGGEQKGS